MREKVQNILLFMLITVSTQAWSQATFDQQAVPAKGWDDYLNSLLRTIKYPADAKRKELAGEVYIEFIVETDGTLSNSRVVSGVGKELDNEALAAIISSPETWVPAKQNNQSVKQTLILPIVFILEGLKTDKKPLATKLKGEILKPIFITAYL